MERRQLLRVLPLSALSVALPMPAIARAFSAEDRVREHFAALAAAMNELTADAHGWAIAGGEQNNGGSVPSIEGRWFGATKIMIEHDPSIRTVRPFLVDRVETLHGLALKMPTERRHVPAIGLYRGRE